MHKFKNIVLGALCATLLGVGLLTAAHHLSPEKPSSVIHVVTVNWKDTATPEQIQAALDGVAKMEYAGLKRVWIKSFKSQTKDAAFVMEFESQKALEDYAGSPAQKAWYELYIPVREQSITSDITN